MARMMAGALCGAALGAAQAGTVSFNAQTYSYSATESLSVNFTSIAGVSTASTYSGLVLVQVAGIGNGAWGGTTNDAFYANLPFGSASSIANKGACGSVAVRTLALPGGCGNYAHQSMVYDLDDNFFVSLAGGTYVPSYQASHTYNFVISADKLLAAAGQSTAQKLFFASTDGTYGDNGGAYNIQVSQLTQDATLPEPASWALAGVALLGLRLTSRRR